MLDLQLGCCKQLPLQKVASYHTFPVEERRLVEDGIRVDIGVEVADAVGLNSVLKSYLAIA